MKQPRIAVLGGGAAGFFAAIQLAEALPGAQVVLFEKHKQLLTKVKISGGGRCNVTHACFEPKELIRHYPRGGKELLGPFHRFQPKDTIEWFQHRGVALKTEEDGRMFPVTNSSQSILDCLFQAANQANVEIRTQEGIQSIEKGPPFILITEKGDSLPFDTVLLATGSAKKGYDLASGLGHTIVDPVPSLFAFCLSPNPYQDLAGISFEEVEASLPAWHLAQRGALLLTPWGMTGPAILKLSAWGARVLHKAGYQGTLRIDFLPRQSRQEISHLLEEAQKRKGAALLHNENPFFLPKRFWASLLKQARVPEECLWSHFKKEMREEIARLLKSSLFAIQGKTPYKEEFVTAGGVKRSEVDWKTMQSRLCPGLFFAGEILDVDGVTGGFNFQNAWTGAWHAAQGIAAGAGGTRSVPPTLSSAFGSEEEEGDSGE